MANVLGDEKRHQILTLGRLGWSLRRIEKETAVRRETASAYLRAAGIAVRRPGGRLSDWPPKPATTGGVSTDSGTAKPAATEGVSTDSAPKEWPRPGRAPAASACEPFREVIEEAVARGRNAMAIWQDLVDDHGFTAGYASVKRFLARLRATAPPEARVVITTAPREEAQVDYGEGPMVRNRETGKYRRTRLFVFTLTHSRKSVRLIVERSSTRVWAELHERAFRRLGGSVQVVVLDNLREGVMTPDTYDPALNPLYRDVLAHYGVVALPCRVRDPDRKGKVESGVGHTQRTPLQGSASRAWRRLRPTSIAGMPTGPTPASTARRSGRWRRCLHGRTSTGGIKLHLHQARQADRERLRRKFQRPLPRRVPQRELTSPLVYASSAANRQGC
jgi:transposase